MNRGSIEDTVEVERKSTESWSSMLDRDAPTRGDTVVETEKTVEAAAVARQRERSATRLEELFNAAVVAHPDAVAVIAGGEQLSYVQLQQRAMVLARHLLALGVKPGELVGLCTRRSADMVIGAFGILMAGGAYVPLDPEYPAERLGYMLDDAGAKVLVSQRPLNGRFAERSMQIVNLDELSADSVDRSGLLDVLPQLDPDQLAYVIYTSGSTGRPKGVMISHRAAVNTVIDMNDRFQVGLGDRVLALSSLCFDLSVYDLFGLLAVGGAVVIPEPERHFEPAHWAELIEQQKITIWNSVPAFMEMFTTYAANRRDGGYGSLRRVMLSGDWIAVSLPDRIRAVAPNAEVISLGGATEVSIWSIYYPIDVVDPAWKSIPYGRALANQTVHVLDDDLQRCDVGVSGEIYIGGDGIAVGYWNRPDLNAEKFIPDPYSDRPDGRLYRTGDLGRYLEDSDIEFLGRIDHQVKIRGFRVELGEIETALVRHPHVSEAVVVARQVASGAKSLVAFLVLNSVADIPDKELAEFLRHGLPDYMIPTRFVRIERMPLNVNGKIDRTALPDTSARTCGESENVRVKPVDFAPARDEIEAQLVEIWEEELDIRPVGIRDTFLDLGGDSLTAVGVFTRIEKEFRRSLPPAALLERPTIESLAELLRDPQLGRQTACLVVVQESGSRPPLICLPGISGNLWEFRRLAKRLGPDIPLYGLQPVGLDGEQEPHESIEEIAEHYLREVRQAQPTGPYYLAGYSIGGVMAYEMAQRLSAAGEKVGVLALFDAPAGGFSWPMRLLKRTVDSVTALVVKAFGPAVSAEHDPLEPVAWSRVSDVHREALDRYVLKDYPGRVEIFRAITRPPWPHRLFHNINLRWLKLAAKGGTVHFVPGNHDQMFRDGNIDVLAKELRNCLLSASET